jgi:hypothetical protein
MFTGTIAARMFTVCALSAVLATTAACGGSGNKSSSTPATTQAATATQAITQLYQQFFDGKTTAEEKIALLENGQDFAATIKAQAGTPMAKSTTATVSNVSATADHATVTFTVLFNGKPAVVGQPGSAIRTGGSWKVTASTFCALLTMEGNPPPACATATPTPTPAK